VTDLESEILDQMHRKIVKNFLDLVILMELRKRSMSGYDLTSLVHNKFHVLMSSGTVYSYLYSLERNGLVKGERGQRRRVYTLTKTGEETVKALLDAKDKILGPILNLFVGE
jgi:DNA-binding PadR family transcriptional regulator